MVNILVTSQFRPYPPFGFALFSRATARRLRAVSYFLQSHWKSIFGAYALTPSENSTDLREKVDC